jgi:hypothetical protein
MFVPLSLQVGSPMTAYPSCPTILSADILVRGGVIHIIDFPNVPIKTSITLKLHGLNSFNALVNVAGQQAKDLIDHAAGVTLLVPQDSALAGIAQRLPQQQLAKLIRDIAKYKRSVNRADAKLLRGGKQLGEQEGGFERQDSSSTTDQQQSQHRLGFSNQLGFGHSERQFAVDTTQSSLLGSSDSLRRGRSDSDLNSRDSSDSHFDSDMRASSELAQAIANMQPSQRQQFDLQKWCTSNGQKTTVIHQSSA